MSYADDQRKCIDCERLFDGGTAKGKRTWWHCSNYFGIIGFFCPQCYDKISHDSYKKPHDPEGYLITLLKLGKTYETH